MTQLKRIWPVLIIFTIFVLAIYLDLPSYLSWQSLQTYHDQIKHWSQSHYVLSMLTYMAVYIISVAISIPGAVFLTLLGGFLYGLILGTMIVVISATIGALLLFVAVQTLLGPWAATKAKGWIKKMQQGFAENAFSYLLILRLIPLFPFWVVNIVPALLKVDKLTFTSATFFGIIPGTVVYVSLGNSIHHLFASNQKPDLGVIFSPPIILPLMGLAVLACLPVVYKKIKKRKHSDASNDAL